MEERSVNLYLLVMAGLLRVSQPHAGDMLYACLRCASLAPAGVGRVHWGGWASGQAEAGLGCRVGVDASDRLHLVLAKGVGVLLK